MSIRGLAIGLVLLCPVAGRADENGKAKAAAYQVPYRLTDTQHVLVRAKINGKGPFNFIVDTGAPALFVATDVAKKIGVAPDKNGWGTFDRFEIEGGVVIPKARGRIETPFQLEGMNGLGLAGATLHGIIGYNLLARYRLEFDFTRDKMTWTRLEGFEPPPPAGLNGKGGAPGGLDALGGLMKFMGFLLGKKAQPELKFRGFLGVELAEKDGGVEVKAILPQSPADKAGLKPGDRITLFEGKAVSSRRKLEQLAAALAAGQSARLTLIRDGSTHKVTVKLAEGL
jgi:hypothetical protein